MSKEKIINPYKLVQQLSLSSTCYNFGKRKIETIPSEIDQKVFIPFVNERIYNGKLKSRKKRIHSKT